MDHDSTYQEIGSYFFVTKPILFFKDKLCLVAGMWMTKPYAESAKLSNP